MRTANPPIFRAEALSHYMERNQKSALPKLVSPRIFLFFWMLLGLSLTGGALTWFAQIPIYASGVAVIVDVETTRADKPSETVALIFLPPETLPRLKLGQPVFFKIGDADTRLSRPIREIEPEPLTPNAINQRFALGVGAASKINDARALVIVPIEPVPATRPASTYVGSFYDAQVEIESRRIVQLLPWVDRHFGVGKP
jgi:hypothetical protein